MTYGSFNTQIAPTMKHRPMPIRWKRLAMIMGTA
jgi:hypothetical protein